MKSFLSALFLSVAMTLSASSAAAQSAGSVPESLFVLKTAAAPNLESRSSIASVQEAEIEFSGANIAGESGRLIAVPLFDGSIHLASRNYVETRAMDDYTWTGRLTTDKFGGDVSLTFRKGHVSGLIQAGDAVYEIVPRGGRHFLVEVDQRLYPECGGGLAAAKQGLPAASGAAAAAGVDSGDRIDVLVVYTTATKNFVGGDAQAQALAQQAVDAANLAYANSRMRQRIRMVHAAEHMYVESGNASTDLSNLRANATIQALRNTHKADLVAMIGEVTGVCGIGYIAGTAGASESGYTVTARSCAVGNLSFAHELGHNMGSHHNPENGGTAIYPYGYGHYVNGVFRTVMSYSDPCPSGCTRRPYFSNPAVTFSGYATGIHNERDNARSMDNTADVMANYRYSGASITLTTFAGADALPRRIWRTVAWTSDNVNGNVRIELSRDEGVTWETLVASTPNDGAESISVGGGPTRRARLRIVSVNDQAISDTNVGSLTLR
ncbi:MAG: M12 family metallo-peptidase [Pyrinomonadaceae bacterium]